MPKTETKVAIVQEIKDKLSRASSIVLVNARGLTVEQDTTLRRKMREENIDYKVYKNTMIRFAVEGTDFAEITPHLEGPTTLAISYEDATAAARVVSDHLKAMPVLEFKAGIIENTLYDAKGVAAIANIPSREVLLGRLLGSFKSPIASFARVINAIGEKDPSEATSVADAPTEAVEEAPAAAPAAVVEEAAPENAAPENNQENNQENNETENKEEE